MTDQGKLVAVKLLHTAVWVFFNLVLGYLVYAVVADRVDVWAWVGLGLVLAECLVLVLFGMVCPLTLVARRYSTSTRENFDIYLPEWLARHNKLIYGTIFAVVLMGLAWRLASGR